jgi:uncharacterized membrane protein YwzB
MEMSIFSNINWLAVLVAAIAYFSLGAIWFSKPAFGGRWVALHQINLNDPEVKKGVGAIMIGSFLLMVLITIALAILVTRLNLAGVLSGVKLGLFTGICFASTAISITFLYIKKPLAIHVIDNLYHVVGQVIAAVILCLWR